MPNITFVDENDNVIGQGTKAEAIEKGIIHRISRVIVESDRGDILIQKRSPNVSVPNRWDQSAAGHVDAGEDYLTAAARELEEEVGIKNMALIEVAKFYSEEVDDGIVKKRFNTLYKTTYSGEIAFDADEVSEVRWIAPVELVAWMHKLPDDFTRGFIMAYDYLNRAQQ